MTNESKSIGDRLFYVVNGTLNELFQLGVQVQLSYSAYQYFHEFVDKHDDDTFTLTYPIGRKPDGTSLLSNAVYNKDELKMRYQNLADAELSKVAIYSLVTLIESMLGDVLRVIMLTYPKKLGKRKQIPLSIVLDADSIDSLHLFAADSLLNELSYKGPKEYAADFQDISGVNLLETPAFHQYVETKVTRDIYIHNKGLANSIYVEKAGILARVKENGYLPVNVAYFLISYEACIQVCESLRDSLHGIWHSEEYQVHKNNLAKNST